MSVLDSTQRWWPTRVGDEPASLDADTPAWLVSLLVHVVVLLALALVGLPPPETATRAIAIVSPPAVEEDVELVPEMTVAPSEDSAVATGDVADLDVTEAVAPVVADAPLVTVDVAEAIEAELVVVDTEALPSGAELGDFMEAGTVGSGETGLGTSNASGAVDRLTIEIANALQQRPTLVCWVFDQSVSLAGQRKEIAGRLGRVFDELRVAVGAESDSALTNLVFAYGQSVTRVMDEPTRDGSRVIQAIESIPVDESGAEMTFTAIHQAAKSAKALRGAASRRNVMIVAFTDEVGDDQQFADAVSRYCRTEAMRVYVVGVPAPFGQGEVAIKFREFDPQFADDVQWARVRQGPETLYPEVVRIRSGTEADEPMDSGFGPFSLSKLCAETGGIYFCVHANRNASGRVGDGEVADMASRLRFFFDPDVMRSYRPDYQPAAKIDQLLAGNRAMRALVEAAKASEIGPMDSPRMEFPRQDDGTLVNLLSDAQKKAAVLEPRIEMLYATLAAGLPDRDKVKERRWQAGYDLAMGRVLALKVRTNAYNIILAQAKTGMKFKDPKNDTWKLVPDDDISNVGSPMEKLAVQARTFLTRVVDEHPGTPWAHLAAAELRQPLGYRWEELHTGVNTPKSGGGGGGGRQRDDMKRTVAPPKPKRPIKNI